MSVQTQIDRINRNIANTYAVLAELGADMPAQQDSDNLAGTAGSVKKEDLDDIIDEQTELIAQIQAALVGKMGLGGLVSENWEFTLTDGTVVTKTVYRGDTND